MTDALERVFQNPEQYGCARLPNSLALDGGVAAPGGWLAGKCAVESLFAGCAEVVLDQMTAGDRRLPTLDVYLDAAVSSSAALRLDGGVLTAPDGAHGVLITEDVPAVLPDSNVLLASPVSLVGHLVEAGLALPRAIQALLQAGFAAEEIFWGYSAAPIVLRSSSAASEKAVQGLLSRAGTLVSVWLRCGDEELRAYLKQWDGPGELRLHNLCSGNTYAGGRIDDAALLRCIEASVDELSTT
ncbi:MAG: hypothetical protein LBN26_02805 [Christensenellaceae bacterium]|jgi:hypothetical protein|nr:hypothetical protein [Christensenellaceae bacterium]